MKIHNENGKVYITGYGDMFIIPNHANRTSEFWFDGTRKRLTKLHKGIAELNGFELGEVDQTLWSEIWICGGNLATENLGDHGSRIEINGGRFRVRLISGHIPTEILSGLKEGESITLKLPCELERYEAGHFDDPRIPAIIELQLTAAQTKYRYRNFGRFEEALAHTSSR